MKIKRVHFRQLAIAVGMAGMLATSGCATSAPNKVQANTTSPKSNLDSATRANHSGLLDPSFYYGNHEISS